MSKHDLGEGWKLEGLWDDKEYEKGNDFTDHEIGHADAIIVSYEMADGHKEYVTIHGADDWEAVTDLIGDIDKDLYFG